MYSYDSTALDLNEEKFKMIFSYLNFVADCFKEAICTFGDAIVLIVE